MKGKSQVIEEIAHYSGKWVECVELSYQDEAGKLCSWEGVHRKHRTDAVIIIPRLVPSGRYILVKQFRPPLDAYILEFPAGLMDHGETPQQTAVRELKEETGYVGQVIQLSPRLYSAPGILSEGCFYAFLEIDETLEANCNPQSQPEPDEFIEVFLQSPETLAHFIQKEIETGSVVDSKLYAYFKESLFAPNPFFHLKQKY